MSLSLGLSFCIREMPIFGHFSMKALVAIHSFLVPNNGLQASGLSLDCKRYPDQQQRCYAEQKKREEKRKCGNDVLFSANKGCVIGTCNPSSLCFFFLYPQFLLDVTIRYAVKLNLVFKFTIGFIPLCSMVTLSWTAM